MMQRRLFSLLLAFLLIAAFVIACAASTGIHLKFLIRGLKPIFFIIIFTFILNLFFQTGGRELVHVGFIRITEDGLRMASFMAVRLILLVVCFWFILPVLVIGLFVGCSYRFEGKKAAKAANRAMDKLGGVVENIKDTLDNNE